MFAKVWAAAVNGIEAYPVEVEVNDGYGDSVIVIVGLPDAAVRESRDRVSTALANSAYKFPLGRLTINLAPADVKKEGPSFDLPIAIGILAASGQIETDQLDHFAMVGELALTGGVGPVGYLSPQDRHSQTNKFKALPRIARLSILTTNPWRTPQKEANRSLSLNASASGVSRARNYGHCY